MKIEYLQPSISSFYDGSIVSKQYKKFSDIGKIFENSRYQKKILFMLKDKTNLYKIQKIFKNCENDLEHYDNLFNSAHKILVYEDCMILLLSRFFFYYDLPITLENISIFEANL